VVKGTIADSDYAANLANVLTGRASHDYPDPPTFFTNTYPTEGLKELLVNVCGRLSGKGESVSAVFRLDTSFGGGKPPLGWMGVKMNCPTQIFRETSDTAKAPLCFLDIIG
jgi:hypothetical protein